MKKCLIISLSILIIFSLILDGCDKGGAGGTKKPVAIITANPTKGSAPLTIVFTGSGQGGNGTIALYQWDFGDGTTSTEQNPTHTYQIAGTYTVTLKVMDSKGNFSDPATITINVTEADLPAVTDIFPPDGAADVPVNASIRITFNKDMNKDTVRNAFSTSPSVNGDISWEGTTFIFTPVQPLDISSSYTATITNAAKDLEGNNLIASITWTFTTAAPPAVISVEPSDGAEEVALDTAIKVIFSEKMDQLSVKDAFSIVPPVSGNFSWNAEGDTMTFTPDNNLAGSTGYTATVSTDAKDLAGNKLITAVTWSFTTRKQEQPPLVAVVSVNPPDGAKDVKLDTDIEATFNREMNKSSVEDAFSVASGSTASSIEGTFSWSSDGKKVIFDPEDDLARGTKYTVTISTGAKDTEGNRLPANFQWSFDTIPENRPPTVTITSPQQGGIFNKGQEINFQGSAVDPEEGELTGDALVWTSSIDGQIGTGKQFTESDLSPGDHTITLTATDSEGAKGTATVNITIRGNQPPVATINSPADGSTFTEGQTINFQGSAIDPEEGELAGNALVWTSSIDGQIGTGKQFTKSDLSPGDHTITLTATDSEGAQGTATVNITISGNQPPVATISSPANGAIFNRGDTINFQGSAVDPEEGELTGNALVWTSSIDGQIGTGKQFSRSDLSVGDHTITLTATDSGGAKGTATVNISVSMAPLVSPGPAPTGLDWDGQYLWNADANDKKIYKIDIYEGKAVAEIPTPGASPRGLAWDGAYLWNVDLITQKIHKLNPTNGTVIKTISSPEVSPTGLAWDGAYLWNADSYSGKVYKIDPSNGSVVKSFTLPGISCEGLGWGGGYLWSSDVSGKKIYKINPVSGTVVKFLPSPGSTPQDLAYDGTFLWNADWSDALLYNITP